MIYTPGTNQELAVGFKNNFLFSPCCEIFTSGSPHSDNDLYSKSSFCHYALKRTNTFPQSNTLLKETHSVSFMGIYSWSHLIVLCVF